jgi:hypothetical protein
MGSSNGSGGNSDLKLVTVSTETLKQRLNQMYDAMRASSRLGASSGLFEYLWDLKEVALLEKRGDVQVPNTWLEELEKEFDRSTTLVRH